MVPLSIEMLPLSIRLMVKWTFAPKQREGTLVGTLVQSHALNAEDRDKMALLLGGGCCVVACGGCARYEKQKHDYDAGEGDHNNITHGFALWLALRRNHIDHPGWST